MIAPASFAELAALAWKLGTQLERELAWLPDDRREGAAAGLRYARRRTDALLAAEGCRLVTYDGERWSAELPPAPVNAAEIGGEAIVESTIDPTVVRGTDVLLAGRVILKDF